MEAYPKITTVYDRDPENNYSTLIEGQFAEPAFEYLAGADWVWREKIHGTNLRLIYQPDNSVPVALMGRTENSQVPSFLTDAILNREGLVPRLREQFGDTPACLYGEGYGAKVQKEGELYIPDGHDFCLFDVKVGEWWLEEEDVTDVAEGVGLTRAPIVGTGPVDHAVQYVADGFPSGVAAERLTAEGLVMHPVVELHTRDGSRVLTKVKHEDFAGNRMMPEKQPA